MDAIRNQPNVLLTIAMPTYNRAERAIRQVGFFLTEIDTISQEVEFLVYDNASSDKTHQKLLFLSEQRHFELYRQDHNVGLARNILACVERARGEYVWIVGDDDRFFPGVLAHVISRLSSQSGPLHVMLRYSFVSGQGADNKKHPAFHGSYRNGRRLILKRYRESSHGAWMFISSNIVHRSAYNRVRSLGREGNLTYPFAANLLASWGSHVIVSDQAWLLDDYQDISWLSQYHAVNVWHKAWSLWRLFSITRDPLFVTLLLRTCAFKRTIKSAFMAILQILGLL